MNKFKMEEDLKQFHTAGYVTIFAIMTDERYLEWDGEMFEQKRTEHGSRYYVVPPKYAHRLLASEPYKFYLSKPDSLDVKVPVPGGGSAYKKFNRVIEKLNRDGSVVRGISGLPELIDPEDAVFIESKD
jgi:hypothetical protein